MTAIFFKILKFIIKPFIGTGIGRFRPIQNCYQWIARSFIIPNEKNIININGYKIQVNLKRKEGLDGISQELIFKGTYEEYTTKLFYQLIKDGMTVVAIGANIGYFALLFSKLVGNRGRVYAFEPAQENYELLLTNIELNGFNNIIPLQKAVAEKSGRDRFFIDASDPGGHSLFQEAINPAVSEVAKSYEIDTVSLDEYLGDGITVDVIQMDIQGAEILATRGMAKILARNPDIKFVTEFWPAGLEKCGFSSRQYWDLLMKFGFKHVYLIDDRKCMLKPVDLVEAIESCKGNAIMPRGTVNLLFVRSPLPDTIVSVTSLVK